MNNHPENTDARIDQVLQALRTTEPPTGLEARITKCIAEASEARAITTSHFTATSSPTPGPFFAVILNAVKDPRILSMQARRYIFAATTSAILISASLIAFHSQHHPHITIQVDQGFSPGSPSAGTAQVPQISRPESPGPAIIQVPQGFSLGSRSTSKIAGVLTPAPQQPDPDTIALAETLAPSHPAPLMPLTQQERLMLSVLRSGDQEEIAALDPAKRDALFALDQAAFHDFFAPPTPAPPTPAPTTGDKE